MGDYHLRAVLGETRAEKTVQVKRYVLPKFKIEVKADKTFLPAQGNGQGGSAERLLLRQTGRRRARSRSRRARSTWRSPSSTHGRATTDANGHAKFEIELPDYFVGQPLQKGNALVKLDVKVTGRRRSRGDGDKSYTVSDQPMRVSLIAEGGKLVPGMENRVFVAAIYPDGSPAANCDVELTHEKLTMPLGRRDRRPRVAVLATVKTNAAGLAEFKLTPKAKQFPIRSGDSRRSRCSAASSWLGPANRVRRGGAGPDAAGQHRLGRQPRWAASRWARTCCCGSIRRSTRPATASAIDVRTSAGLPTVYLDIVRGGQIVLSRWLDVNDGRANHTLDLPQAIFGSVEVHAYQMLRTGEIIRDSRVVYVQPRNDLKVDGEARARRSFAPGEDAMIRFHVTDAAGKPTAAALGVIIVDEAVYAMQDLQPGLEKVYFTLQEELLKPHVQAAFGPNDTIDNLVRAASLAAAAQQVAAGIADRGAAAAAAPLRRLRRRSERSKRSQRQVQQIGWALFAARDADQERRDPLG